MTNGDNDLDDLPPPKPQPTDEEKTTARDLWDKHHSGVVTSMAHTITFGVAALRAPALINGAAIATLLAFVTGNVERLTGQAEIIGASVFWLLTGLLASALASGAAYFTQYAYTYADSKYQVRWEHPYIVDEAGWRTPLAVGLHLVAIGLVLLGYFGFVKGVLNFYELVKVVLATSS